MHQHITHNRCYERFADFKSAILTFLREEVPRNWGVYCDDRIGQLPYHLAQGFSDSGVNGVYQPKHRPFGTGLSASWWAKGRIASRLTICR